MKLKKLFLMMLAALGLVILVMALVFIFMKDKLTSNTGAFKYEQRQLPLEVKKDFISFGYDVLNDYFGLETKSGCSTCRSNPVNDFSYNKLYSTIIVKGETRGCVSSSSGKMYEDIKQSLIQAIEDERYGGKLDKSELKDAQIVFTFLYNRRKVDDRKLASLEKEVELGVDAIEVLNGDNNALFKESVPIAKNYSLEKTFERLCSKAKLQSDCYLDENTEIYLYEALTFTGDREQNITDLYRYNILVNEAKINKEDILNHLSLSRDWFLNTVGEEGILGYKYYPSSGEYSTDNNHVRQLATLWAMTELNNFLIEEQGENYESRADLNKLINDTLSYYSKYLKEKEGGYYLEIDGDAKLAFNAFMLMSLVNASEYPNADEIAQKLALGILNQQEKDGSYKTNFNSEENSSVDFYPGEAMLSLMKAYLKTNDNQYLESVKKAFPYYRDYWRENKNTAFIPWHTQAYYLLYQQTKDPELADFVFEMNDWLLKGRTIQVASLPDELGGIAKDNPDNTTNVRLEGLNDAYMLAKETGDKERETKYFKVVHQGIRFILQNQFTPQNTFYFEKPELAIGGFKKSLIQNDLRIDYTQHAISALMKSYRYGIFN